MRFSRQTAYLIPLLQHLRFPRETAHRKPLRRGNYGNAAICRRRLDKFQCRVVALGALQYRLEQLGVLVEKLFHQPRGRPLQLAIASGAGQYDGNIPGALLVGPNHRN